MKRWLVGALVVALVPVALPEAVAAEPSCTLDIKAYCALADSRVSLTCSLAETEAGTDYVCNVLAKHRAVGRSRAPGPGQLLLPSTVEVGVCNGESLCEQSVHDIGTPCEWSLREHGCRTSGRFTTSLAGTLDGCLYVWVFQDIDARVRLPNVAADLARAEERAIREFDSCA